MRFHCIAGLRVGTEGTENNRTPSVSGPIPSRYILNDGAFWMMGHGRLYYLLKTTSPAKSTDVSKCIFKDMSHSSVLEAFSKFNRK
jgi:hypothetical protein